MLGQLLVIAGPDKGRFFTFSEEELIIGRGEASQAQINDPRISRVHCRLDKIGKAQSLVADDPP